MISLECNFSINENRRLNIDDSKLTLFSENNIICEIVSREFMDTNQHKPICESLKLTIKCTGFNNEQEAYDYSKYIFFSLHYFGIKYNLRINKDKKNFSLGTVLKTGVYPIVENDAIIIYDESNKPLIMNMEMKAFQKLNDDQKLLINSFPIVKITNSSIFRILSNSLELLNTTVSESNSSTRILTIIMALEMLTNILSDDEKMKDLEQIDIIENCIKYVKSSFLFKAYTNDLLSSIGKLKKESIKQKIVKLIKKAQQPNEILGYSLEKFISSCYGIRSSITHGGNILENDILDTHSLNSVVQELNKVTVNLIDYLVSTLEH